MRLPMCMGIQKGMAVMFHHIAELIQIGRSGITGLLEEILIQILEKKVQRMQVIRNLTEMCLK